MTETAGPVLLDFGVAATNISDTQNAQKLGSAGYAAPEQSVDNGQIGPWTDIYGLAATLYRCVSGRIPTAAATRQQLADELDFDVDNPMILAEMSHILSKNPVSDLNSEITFAPETFDLDKIFAESDSKTQKKVEKPAQKTLDPLILILIVSVIVIVSGLLLFYRRK